MYLSARFGKRGIVPILQIIAALWESVPGTAALCWLLMPGLIKGKGEDVYGRKWPSECAFAFVYHAYMVAVRVNLYFQPQE